MSRIIFFIILFFQNTLSFAASVQPTVMVIPFAKESEQLRTVYERDDMLNLRVAVTKVKEALDAEDIPTIDFRAKLKQLSRDDHMTMSQQKDIKQRVIELSGADVYVEVEAAVNENPDGSSVTVIVNAYDAFSGEVLASDMATTKKFYTYNFEKLSQKAVSHFIKSFTKNIRQKFEAQLTTGRTIVVQIGFDEDADIDLDEPINGDTLLATIIEDWINEHAHRQQYHLQGVTASTMIFDEVKIPVKTENGRTYRITRFAASLRSFLKKQGLEVTRDVVGTKVYITIH